MSTLAIGYIGIGILFLFLLSGMPIGFVMAFLGFVGFAILTTFDSAVGLLRTVPYTSFADYGMSVIPLFVLMGSFCFYSGLSKDLYAAVHNWLGHLRGGLAMATVGAAACFAAISGSSLATAATIGTVALPEMKRYKYSDALATGAVAAGGTIGILIPPSTVLILYGVITEQSIGKLFMAGFLPGILQAIFYMIAIFIICKIDPLKGPKGPKTSLKEKVVELKGTGPVLVLFLVIMGGIYLGVFSPTEAAGIGAFGAFAIGVCRRRLKWTEIKESFIDTGKTTALIFVIICGAMILGYFLAVTRIPTELASMISSWPVSPYLILVFVLLIYMVLGCVMDSMAIMLLVTPIFFPLVLELGINPIWFGILITRVTEIGLITPPVGLNVYVIKGVADDVPMGTIFKGVLPFLVADVCHVALLIALPQIALLIPNLMG